MSELKPPPGPERPNPTMSERRPGHHHDGIYVMVGGAVVFSVMALFVAMGPCVDQEDVRVKVEHLEQRLDNLRDR